MQIATVADADDPAELLTVAVTSPLSSNGVTLSDLTVEVDGTVKASITVPSCPASAVNATFTLQVTDTSNQSATATLTVLKPANDPPVLTYAPTKSLVVGGSTTVSPTAGPIDPEDGTAIGLVTIGQPTIRPLSPTAPSFTGTVTRVLGPLSIPTGSIDIKNAGPIGDYLVELPVTDRCGATTVGSFTLNVTCAPINWLNVVMNPTCNGGNDGRITINATGGTGALRYSKDNGQSFQDSNVFEGLTAGTYKLVIKDSLGCMTGQSTVTLTQPEAVTFTATPVNPTCNGASNGQITINASGGAGAFQYSINDGQSFQSGNVFTGLAAGAYDILVKDGSECVSSVQRVTLTQPATLSLTPNSLTTATAGAAFSQTFSASGGTGAKTLKLNGGLPAWLSFNEQTGVLSGTPPQTGSVSFSITVTDQNNCALTQSYTLQIVCPPSITLTPTSLPVGVKGVGYSETLSASPVGGAYKFAVTSGALPTGLSLDPTTGVLSGTPTTVGVSDFTVTATGFGSCQGSRAYTITINSFGGDVTDPFACTGPGDPMVVTAEVINSGTLPQTVNFSAAIPPQLLALPGTCVASVGICAVVNASSVTWDGTLNGGQKLTINYKVQVADGTPSGSTLCITSTATFNQSPPRSVVACATINCPEVGPGNALAAKSEVSDQKSGSVLIYNLYTSSASNPNSQNTRISLTNTHAALSARVHLFFVDGASCSVADNFVCLTPNQTTSFLVSDLDPGSTGYIVAVAVDEQGCPANFNYLIGDEYVKFESGHAANLGAEAISAIAGGLPRCDDSSTVAELKFDGVSYNRLPRALALSNVGSRADGADTMLVLNRIGGNLATGVSALNSIFGIFYDDAERGVSFTFNSGACQLRSSITNNFPRITPRFDQLVPAGRSGWLKLYSTNDQAILGAAINFNEVSLR